MSAFIRTTLFIATTILSACAAEKNYLVYSDWDADEDLKLDRTEFIDAYVNSGYFDKWSAAGSSISYTELYTTIYHSVDEDSNMKICPDEFVRNMKPFYFGMFSERFDAWDGDENHTLSLNEFNAHIAQSKLASHWDLNADSRISKREMAEGMFYQCDLNNNRIIDQPEFNLWQYLR